MKCPSHTRIVQAGPDAPDKQWAMDVVSDSLMGRRRIRVLTIADPWDRSSPAFEVEMSLPGVRVVRSLEKLRRQGIFPIPHGKPHVSPMHQPCRIGIGLPALHRRGAG